MMEFKTACTQILMQSFIKALAKLSLHPLTFSFDVPFKLK